MYKRHVVFAGNPGVGKSTILNAFMGKNAFASGVAIGEGLTTALQTCETERCYLSDTPGLDDIARREQAASEIASALGSHRRIHLIFVCTLESGRVKPADLATIRIVLKGIDDVGVDASLKYSVIINKCSESVLRLCNTPQGREKIRLKFSKYKSVNYLSFFPVVPYATDTMDTIVTGEHAERYRAFILGSPFLEIPRNSRVTIDTSVLTDIHRKYYWELRQLSDKLEEIEDEMKYMRCAQIAHWLWSDDS